MTFKINLRKFLKDLEIGDVVEIERICYVITEFREQSSGKRVWGVSVNGGKLTHLFGLEYYREHVKEGKVKLIQYVQNQG